MYIYVVYCSLLKLQKKKDTVGRGGRDGEIERRRDGDSEIRRFGEMLIFFLFFCVSKYKKYNNITVLKRIEGT